ncbi:hypothetical protein GGR53DRAFT_159518 [Hypoxylon sp. FL1150]|nr:hypothetical protein GGR53DRAFT_159518 [Hypoxylon sp. FL1150]
MVIATVTVTLPASSCPISIAIKRNRTSREIPREVEYLPKVSSMLHTVVSQRWARWSSSGVQAHVSVCAGSHIYDIDIWPAIFAFAPCIRYGSRETVTGRKFLAGNCICHRGPRSCCSSPRLSVGEGCPRRIFRHRGTSSECYVSLPVYLATYLLAYYSTFLLDLTSNCQDSCNTSQVLRVSIFERLECSRLNLRKELFLSIFSGSGFLYAIILGIIMIVDRR